MFVPASKFLQIHSFQIPLPNTGDSLLLVFPALGLGTGAFIRAGGPPHLHSSLPLVLWVMTTFRGAGEGAGARGVWHQEQLRERG